MNETKTIVDELKLLTGLPIRIENVCEVFPLKIGDISKMGQNEFNLMLTYLLLDDKKIEVSEDIFVSPLDYMILSNLENGADGKRFERYLEMITHEKIHTSSEGFFYFGDISENRKFDSDSLVVLKEIIKKQYFLNDDESSKSKSTPANDKARELIERLENYKKQIKKENSEKGMELSDIVSVVASYAPNINIINVCDLTVYQIYHLYIRLINKDTYDSQFQLLCQGADPKELKLEHWANKIKNK